MTALAHYDADSNRGEPLKEHLLHVARKAAEFADAFSASSEAYAAGLLHDLGKYGNEFQRRLEGELRGVDHWSDGAWYALTNYKINGIASAVAIQGHHLGLQEASKDCLKQLNPQKLKNNHPLGLTISCADVQSLHIQGINIPAEGEFTSLYEYDWNDSSKDAVGAMLDLRMLFSVLVDADFLETEAWFNGDATNRRYRQPCLPLAPARALAALKEYVGELAQHDIPPHIRRIRSQVFSACLEAANKPQGIFTLTAPTGSGKTLGMLAFALSHALRHNLRRIVTVLPYLTLIEQTVAVYRKVVEKFVRPDEIDRYLLEHHSLSGVRYVSDSSRYSEDNLSRLLAENWDAPIIVTTNVQFLESLFSNRPSACRKLHRLARSVILLDEVQTMPDRLIIATLGALSRLVHQRYSTTIVFATATQPAFSHLDNQLREYCGRGWQPHEIVVDAPSLFKVARRTRITLPSQSQNISWEDLAEVLSRERQVLCIVNLKRHAKTLFEKLKAIDPEGVYHLSTNMCPAHRQDVLDKVRRLLEKQQPCRLVSTQCVEAGVDIDFPVVYRSLGPLDAIAQAAGRCNRNGTAVEGLVRVFQPDDKENYPDPTYKQAAAVTKSILAGVSELDPADLNIFERYYRELYAVRGIGRGTIEDNELLAAICRQDFPQVCHLYRVIPQNTINILVPYEPDIFNRLTEEVRANGLTRQWIIKARPYTVAIFHPSSPRDPIYLNLEPIKIRPDKAEESDEWYIYRKEDDYDKETGLNPSLAGQAIIA